MLLATMELNRVGATQFEIVLLMGESAAFVTTFMAV